MKNNLVPIIASAFIAILLYPPVSLSQQRDDFIRPFFGYQGSQSLGTAIGNATVASGQVIPGMSSNPANIGLSRFGHLQANFQTNSFEGPGITSDATVPGGVYAIFPVPVYQGSLAFSAGIQKLADFSNGFNSGTRQAAETGGLFATELGAAYEASRDFMIGGSIRYLKGSNEFSLTESDTNSLLSPDYRGYAFTVGFLNRSTEHLHLGASVDFPVSLHVRDKLSVWPKENPRNSTTETWKYTLTRPLAFHGGLALLYPLWSGFYELEWSDWSGLEFSSKQYFEGDIAEINREISRDFRSTLSHHLGVSGHLPWLPLHLYGGYQYLPAPFKGVYKGDRRQSVSAGASILLNQQFSMHGSISNYFWDYLTSGGGIREESYRMVVFGSTLHF